MAAPINRCKLESRRSPRKFKPKFDLPRTSFRRLAKASCLIAAAAAVGVEEGAEQAQAPACRRKLQPRRRRFQSVTFSGSRAMDAPSRPE
jgi:hypothetical protein